MEDAHFTTSFEWSFPTSPHFIKEIIIGIIIVIFLGFPIHVTTEYPLINIGPADDIDDNEDIKNDNEAIIRGTRRGERRGCRSGGGVYSRAAGEGVIQRVGESVGESVGERVGQHVAEHASTPLEPHGEARQRPGGLRGNGYVQERQHHGHRSRCQSAEHCRNEPTSGEMGLAATVGKAVRPRSAPAPAEVHVRRDAQRGGPIEPKRRAPPHAPTHAPSHPPTAIAKRPAADGGPSSIPRVTEGKHLAERLRPLASRVRELATALQGATLLRTPKGLILVASGQLGAAGRSASSARSRTLADPETITPRHTVLSTLPHGTTLPFIPPIQGISPIIYYPVPIPIQPAPIAPTPREIPKLRPRYDVSMATSGSSDFLPTNAQLAPKSEQKYNLSLVVSPPSQTSSISSRPSHTSPQEFELELPSLRGYRNVTEMSRLPCNPRVAREYTGEVTPEMLASSPSPTKPTSSDDVYVRDSKTTDSNVLRLATPVNDTDVKKVSTTLVFKRNFTLHSSSTQTNLGYDLCSVLGEQENFPILQTEVMESEVGTQTELNNSTIAHIHKSSGNLLKNVATQTIITTFEATSKKSQETRMSSLISIVESLSNDFVRCNTRTAKIETSALKESCSYSPKLINTQKHNDDYFQRPASTSYKEETSCITSIDAHSVFRGTPTWQNAKQANACVDKLSTHTSSERLLTYPEHSSSPGWPGKCSILQAQNIRGVPVVEPGSSSSACAISSSSQTSFPSSPSSSSSTSAPVSASTSQCHSRESSPISRVSVNQEPTPERVRQTPRVFSRTRRARSDPWRSTDAGPPPRRMSSEESPWSSRWLGVGGRRPAARGSAPAPVRRPRSLPPVTALAARSRRASPPPAFASSSPLSESVASIALGLDRASSRRIERASHLLFRRSRQMVWRLTNESRAFRDRIRRMYLSDEVTSDNLDTATTESMSPSPSSTRNSASHSSETVYTSASPAAASPTSSSSPPPPATPTPPTLPSSPAPPSPPLPPPDLPFHEKRLDEVLLPWDGPCAGRRDDHSRFVADDGSCASVENGDRSRHKKHCDLSRKKPRPMRSTPLRSPPGLAADTGSTHSSRGSKELDDSKQHHNKMKKRSEKKARRIVRNRHNQRVPPSSAKMSTTEVPILPPVSVASKVSEKELTVISECNQFFEDVFVKLLETEKSVVNFPPSFLSVTPIISSVEEKFNPDLIDHDKSSKLTPTFKTNQFCELSVHSSDSPIMTEYDESTDMTNNTNTKSQKVIKETYSDKSMKSEIELIDNTSLNIDKSLEKEPSQIIETSKTNYCNIPFLRKRNTIPSFFVFRSMENPLEVFTEKLNCESQFSHSRLSFDHMTDIPLQFVDTKSLQLPILNSDQFHESVKTEQLTQVSIDTGSNKRTVSSIERVTTHIQSDLPVSSVFRETEFSHEGSHAVDNMEFDKQQPNTTIRAKSAGNRRKSIGRRYRSLIIRSPFSRMSRLRSDRTTVAKAAAILSVYEYITHPIHDNTETPPSPDKVCFPKGTTSSSSHLTSPTLPTVKSADEVVSDSVQSRCDLSSPKDAITCDTIEEVAELDDKVATSLPGTDLEIRIPLRTTMQSDDSDEVKNAYQKIMKHRHWEASSTSPTTPSNYIATSNSIQPVRDSLKKVKHFECEKSRSPSGDRSQQALSMAVVSLPLSSIFPLLKALPYNSSSHVSSSTSTNRSVKPEIPPRPHSECSTRSRRSPSSRPRSKSFSVASSNSSPRSAPISSNTHVHSLPQFPSPKHKPDLESICSSRQPHDTPITIQETTSSKYKEGSSPPDLTGLTSPCQSQNDTPSNTSETSEIHKSELGFVQTFLQPFKCIQSEQIKLFQTDDVDRLEPCHESTPQNNSIKNHSNSIKEPEYLNVPEMIPDRQKHVLLSTSKSRTIVTSKSRPLLNIFDSPSSKISKSTLSASTGELTVPVHRKDTSKAHVLLPRKQHTQITSITQVRPTISVYGKKTKDKESNLYKKESFPTLSLNRIQRSTSSGSKTPSSITSDISATTSLRSDIECPSKSAYSSRLKTARTFTSRDVSKMSSTMLISLLRRDYNSIQTIPVLPVLSSENNYLHQSLPTSARASFGSSIRPEKKQSLSFDSTSSRETSSRESKPFHAVQPLPSKTPHRNIENSLHDLLSSNPTNKRDEHGNSSTPSCEKILQELLTNAIRSLHDLMVTGVIDEQKTAEATAAVTVAMDAARSALGSGKPLLSKDRSVGEMRPLRTRVYRPLDVFRKHRANRAASSDSGSRRHDLTDKSSLISFSSLTLSEQSSSSLHSSHRAPKSDKLSRLNKSTCLKEFKRIPDVTVGHVTLPKVPTNKKKTCSHNLCHTEAWKDSSLHENLDEGNAVSQNQFISQHSYFSTLKNKMQHFQTDMNMSRKSIQSMNKDLKTCSKQTRKMASNKEGNDNVTQTESNTKSSRAISHSKSERKQYMTRHSDTTASKITCRSVDNVKHDVREDKTQNQKHIKKTRKMKPIWKVGIAVNSNALRPIETNLDNSTVCDGVNSGEPSGSGVQPPSHVQNNTIKRHVGNTEPNLSLKLPVKDIYDHPVAENPSRKLIRARSRHSQYIKRKKTKESLSKNEYSCSSTRVRREPVKYNTLTARWAENFSKRKPSVIILHEIKSGLPSHLQVSDTSNSQTSGSHIGDNKNIMIKTEGTSLTDISLLRKLTSVSGSLSPIMCSNLLDKYAGNEVEYLRRQGKEDAIQYNRRRPVYPSKTQQVVPTPTISVISGENSRTAEGTSISSHRGHRRYEECKDFSQEGSVKSSELLILEPPDVHQRNRPHTTEAQTTVIEKHPVDTSQVIVDAALEDIFPSVKDDITSIGRNSTQIRKEQEFQRSTFLDHHERFDLKSPLVPKLGKSLTNSIDLSNNVSLNSVDAFAFVNSRISDLRGNNPASQLHPFQEESQDILKKEASAAEEVEDGEVGARPKAETEVQMLLPPPQTRGLSAFAASCSNSAYSVFGETNDVFGPVPKALGETTEGSLSDVGQTETAPTYPTELIAPVQRLQALALELDEAQPLSTSPASAPSTGITPSFRTGFSIIEAFKK